MLIATRPIAAAFAAARQHCHLPSSGIFIIAYQYAAG
jgi:hypothetical protein